MKKYFVAEVCRDGQRISWRSTEFSDLTIRHLPLYMLDGIDQCIKAGFDVRISLQDKPPRCPCCDFDWANPP